VEKENKGNFVTWKEKEERAVDWQTQFFQDKKRLRELDTVYPLIIVRQDKCYRLKLLAKKPLKTGNKMSRKCVT